jgi:hypothetical protein
MDESSAHVDDPAARETRLVGRAETPASESPAPPTGAERAPGSLIGGRYRLERQLNSGGMGTVHLAQPLGGNQKVVVKFPHAHLLASPGFLARFGHEIEALQKLTHPHVVEIYDAGTDCVREGGIERQLPYLVVRYMSGGSLKDRIVRNGGRLRPTQLEWLRPIADALDFIHSQNVVHLDVKPENLLFDVHGTVYLTDFGIAKLSGAGSEPDFTGILGSPSYMAPEYTGRAQSTESDAYTLDQYSLAVVVYEALSGALPHSGDTVPALLASKLADPPESIAERCPELPRAAVQAIMRGLAREPSGRFDSCGAFADAVLAALRPPRRRARWPLALALAALLASAGGYAYVRSLPPSLGAQIGSVSERLAEVDAEGRSVDGRLAALRAEVHAVAARVAELPARGARARAYGVSTSAASLTLPEVQRSLAEIEILRSYADGEQRELVELRERVSPLQAQAAALQRRVESQRADARVQADRIFDVRMRVAQLQDQTAGTRPDPRIGALARDVSALESAGSSDVTALGEIEAELDGAFNGSGALLARIAADERSLEDESRKLAQAELALLARRAELARR